VQLNEVHPANRPDVGDGSSDEDGSSEDGSSHEDSGRYTANCKQPEVRITVQIKHAAHLIKSLTGKGERFDQSVVLTLVGGVVDALVAGMTFGESLISKVRLYTRG